MGNMPRPTDAYRGLAQSSRLRVLAALMDTPGAGLADLSPRLGLHVNTLRDHLRVLESEGLVRSEIEHTGRRGRPRLRFSPVLPTEPNEVEDRRLQEAIRQGELMRAVLPATRSGLPLAATHQLDALVHHLDDVGLRPKVDEKALTVELFPCRFHVLLTDDQSVICRVHEELMRSVLARAGGPVEIDHVTAFSTTRPCRVRLRLREEAGDFAGNRRQLS